MANYYLYRNEKNEGPFPEEQLKAMITMGEVKGEELIFKDGGTDWVPASTLAEAQDSSSTTPATSSATPVGASAASATGTAGTAAAGNVSQRAASGTTASSASSTVGSASGAPASCPGGLKFVGWLFIIFGVLSVIMGILTLFAPIPPELSTLEGDGVEGLEGFDPTVIFQAYKTFLGILMPLFGILYFLVGRAVMKGKKWAWITALIISIIGFLNPLLLVCLIILLLKPSKAWCKI